MLLLTPATSACRHIHVTQPLDKVKLLLYVIILLWQPPSDSLVHEIEARGTCLLAVCMANAWHSVWLVPVSQQWGRNLETGKRCCSYDGFEAMLLRSVRIE